MSSRGVPRDETIGSALLRWIWYITIVVPKVLYPIHSINSIGAVTRNINVGVMF